MRSLAGQTLAMLLTVFVASCSTTKRPTTNTQAPILDTSKEMNRQVRSNIVDSKDAISRSRSLNQVIDNKLNLLQDYK
jgi:hypothetical protein